MASFPQRNGYANSLPVCKVHLQDDRYCASQLRLAGHDGLGTIRETPRRPLTMREIKQIMKMALWGLREVHNEGLVYYDFKMENILLTGFDNENAPSDDESVPLMLYAKLADLGSVMAPSRGEVTSIAYRSPEVYFNKPWTSAIDIWAWGIACFHLLQARINFSSHGVYDCIIKDGMLEQKANAVRTVQCHDFNVRSNEYFQNCNCSICDKVNVDLGDERWTDRLVAQGGSGV